MDSACFEGRIIYTTQTFRKLSTQKRQCVEVVIERGLIIVIVGDRVQCKMYWQSLIHYFKIVLLELNDVLNKAETLDLNQQTINYSIFPILDHIIYLYNLKLSFTEQYRNTKWSNFIIYIGQISNRISDWNNIFRKRVVTFYNIIRSQRDLWPFVIKYRNNITLYKVF